jgi:hypothetical protein
MPSDYSVLVVRGYTKERLALRVYDALAGRAPEEIVSINYFCDPWLSFFWRRNSALVVVRQTRSE